jgi:hypothetical protein
MTVPLKALSVAKRSRIIRIAGQQIENVLPLLVGDTALMTDKIAGFGFTARLFFRQIVES